MIRSLKNWLKSAEGVKNEKLFNSHDESVQQALATVLFKLIIADGEESDMERYRFAQIFKEEFGLHHETIRRLYFQAQAAPELFDEHLALLNQQLKKQAEIRMAFVSKLNGLMGLDGVLTSEMKVFDQILSVIMPEYADSAD